MNKLIISLLLLSSFTVNAAVLPCSIHPAIGASAASLLALATVSRADAERTAMSTVKAIGASVVSGELEAEEGCLIYSFDIQIPNRKYVIEVAVDAGTGEVLAKKKEGPKAQAAEKAADEAAAAKK